MGIIRNSVTHTCSRAKIFNYSDTPKKKEFKPIPAGKSACACVMNHRLSLSYRSRAPTRRFCADGRAILRFLGYSSMCATCTISTTKIIKPPSKWRKLVESHDLRECTKITMLAIRLIWAACGAEIVNSLNNDRQRFTLIWRIVGAV